MTSSSKTAAPTQKVAVKVRRRGIVADRVVDPAARARLSAELNRLATAGPARSTDRKA